MILAKGGAAAEIAKAKSVMGWAFIATFCSFRIFSEYPWIRSRC
jgi:hypothetical protein